MYPGLTIFVFIGDNKREDYASVRRRGGNLGHEKRRPLFFALRGRIYSVATILFSRETGLRDVFECVSVLVRGGLK